MVWVSKPRYGWWSFAKHLVRTYPELKQEYDALHAPRITADTTRIPGGGSVSKPTENTALRSLPAARQADYDAVTKAIEMTSRLKTGPERLKLIDMVFWKQSHTLDGASYALGYSYENGQRYHQDFLRLVGLYRGLEDSV